MAVQVMSLENVLAGPNDLAYDEMFEMTEFECGVAQCLEVLDDF